MRGIWAPRLCSFGVWPSFTFYLYLFGDSAPDPDLLLKGKKLGTLRENESNFCWFWHFLFRMKKFGEELRYGCPKFQLLQPTKGASLRDSAFFFWAIIGENTSRDLSCIRRRVAIPSPRHWQLAASRERLRTGRRTQDSHKFARRIITTRFSRMIFGRPLGLGLCHRKSVRPSVRL